MSLKIRALIPALALSGALLALSPAALADPPHRAYSYSYGHSNYSPSRDYRDRRAPAPRVYYYERRNDYGRYYDDYRYRQPTYRYQGNRGYGGYYGSYYGGCSANGALTVMGAVTGGIIGSRSGSYRNQGVNTVVGALAGGILGNAIGSSIDGGCRGY